MSIKVKCRNCSKAYTVADTNAGKRFRCKQCEKPITVPKPKDEDEFEDWDNDDSEADDWESEDDNYDDWFTDEEEDEGEYDDYDDYDSYVSPIRRLPAKRKQKTQAKRKKSSGRHKRAGDAELTSFGFICEHVDFVSPLIWLVVPIAFHVISYALQFVSPFLVTGFYFVAAFVLIPLAMIAGICSLIDVFTEDVTCGLLYLFVPFYAFYYIITRWEQQRQTFMCSMILINIFVTPLILGLLLLIPLLLLS